MRAAFVALGATLFLVLPHPAWGAQIDIDFNFDTLSFRFHPEGLEDSKTKGNGSGTEVSAQNIRIADEDAVDLRHCIDGWDEPACSYASAIPSIFKGDRDGEAEPGEVEVFRGLAKTALSGIPKIERLTQLLKENITVDGKRGERPRVVDFQLRDAAGPVSSTQTIFADAVVEVGYENRKDAAHHEIHVTRLHLDQEGFAYATVVWIVSSDATWEFRRAETQPGSAQGFVDANGWRSNQSNFEAATDSTLRLSMDRTGSPSASGFPTMLLVWGLVGAVLVAGAVTAYVLARRRKR